ncbi:hypothetical protein ACFRCG_29140 [Embleya sp. NPDC056575]|uniref:hypothetical protein n=1 Tax=unclassified Embleya TaxID=2699296 RepID=UPI003691A11E
MLRLFHPLWDAVADEDLLHIDQTCARGNFRSWAKITSHLYAARHHEPGRNVDHTLPAWACSRLGPPPRRHAALRTASAIEGRDMGSSDTQPPAEETRPAPAALPGLDAVSRAALRAPAVRSLPGLRSRRELTTNHVRTTAQCLGVSERTVWRRPADAVATPAAIVSPDARDSDRFEITPPIRLLPAYWHGNASAVHRELVVRARTATGPGTPAGDPAAPASPPPPPSGTPLPGGAPPAAVPVLDPLPSLSTFLRALRRQGPVEIQRLGRADDLRDRGLDQGDESLRRTAHHARLVGFVLPAPAHTPTAA